MSQNYSAEKITLLLEQASSGDDSALHDLTPLVYPDLRKIASGIRHKKMNVSDTLNTTSLVNEAWLKLSDYGIKASNRKHFFCIASKAMRQILINAAQSKLTDKRKAQKINIDEIEIASDERAEWMVQLEHILKSLESKNKRMSEVFHLKYFLGFSEAEIATTLNITDRTVRRDWLSVKKIIQDLMS